MQLKKDLSCFLIKDKVMMSHHLHPAVTQITTIQSKITHTHTRSPDHVLGRALGFWAMLMARPGQLVDRLRPDMGTDEGPDTWSGASGVRWGGAR